jgi:hypothetical protein
MPRKPITIIWPRMEPRAESNRGTDVNQPRVEKRRISAAPGRRAMPKQRSPDLGLVYMSSALARHVAERGYLCNGWSAQSNLRLGVWVNAE